MVSSSLYYCSDLQSVHLVMCVSLILESGLVQSQCLHVCGFTGVCLYVFGFCFSPCVNVHTLTSVWSVLARCSLALSDSFSTSMCCLQSEFWLVSVSSLVCSACISDSFLFSSCFSCSIWQSHTHKHTNTQIRVISEWYTWYIFVDKTCIQKYDFSFKPMIHQWYRYTNVRLVHIKESEYHEKFIFCSLI